MIQIHDLKLVGIGNAITTDKGIALLNGIQDFSVYNVIFDGFGDYGILVQGDARGVIYDCDFIDCYTDRVGYGVAVNGDGNWDSIKPPLGTQNAVFIEDCYFTGCKHAVSSNNNSHYVFRYNLVMGLKHNKYGVDAHGKQDTWAAGSNTWEIYENTINGSYSDSQTDWGICVRGGSGVIWNNSINGCDNLWTPKAIAISIDEYGSYPADYPDPYQVKDLYVWNNRADGDPLNEVYLVSAAADWVRINREYWLSPKSGYQAYPYPHTLRASAPILSVTPQSMAFEAAYDGNNPSGQTFQITHTGGNPLPWTITDNANWLYTSVDSGSGQAAVTVTVVKSGLASGTYNARITISAPAAANSPKTIDVSLTISSPVTTTMSLDMTHATGAPALGEGGDTTPGTGIHSYSVGSSVSIKAQINPGYRFSKWQGDINDSNRYDSNITLVMDRNRMLKAVFFTKCGDVNGDLEVSPIDAQTAFDIFLNKASSPTESQLENADVNCDGTTELPMVTPKDAQAIFKYYLGKKALPGDCSCSSRSTVSTLSDRMFGTAEALKLCLEDIQTEAGNRLMVPISLDSDLGLDAFGFDLVYSAEMLEFEGIARTEMTQDFAQLDGSEISEGRIRVGGYSHEAAGESESKILVMAVFKVKENAHGQGMLILSNGVDDLRGMQTQSTSVFISGPIDDQFRLDRNPRVRDIIEK